VLAALREGQALDARGVEFDQPLLAEVLGAAERTDDDRPLLRQPDFRGARFADDASFERVVFTEGARFDGAVFGERVSFIHAQFAKRASFRHTRFGHRGDFNDSVFGHGASFAGAEFGDRMLFNRSHFDDRANFAETTWGAGPRFIGASFGARTRFDLAKFGVNARFRDAVFGRDASLRKVKFGDQPSFERASFGGETSFSNSTFGSKANFSAAEFGAGISFRAATFGAGATFRRAVLGDRAWFTNVEFGAGAAFAHATFAGRARFNLTSFGDRATFEGSSFAGEVSFERAVFHGRVTFRLATFKGTRSFGPLLVVGLLSLEQAAFLETVRVDVSAHRIRASRTRFPQGVHLRLRWSEIVLDEATFDPPAVVTFAAPFSGLNEKELVAKFELDDVRPRLTSVRRADLTGVVLADLDLRACAFAGAHNLDRVRLEGGLFARSPRGTARRQVIAEEQDWRARTPGRPARRWEAPAFTFTADNVTKPRTLPAEQIASIYRDLRRGREINGDAPGAADFYYGEMEMRRLDPARPLAERVLLVLYWLTAGYGLRATRSLIALALTIVAFALLLWKFGFDAAPKYDPPGLGRSLLFSAESTSNLFRAPRSPHFELTSWGEAMQIPLRLLGPLFFGLALVSLRGRVRR